MKSSILVDGVMGNLYLSFTIILQNQINPTFLKFYRFDANNPPNEIKEYY